MQTHTDDSAIDFEMNNVTVRTPEEAAAHKALTARQDRAAGIAFRGVMASGHGLEAAKRAAAKARRETT